MIGQRDDELLAMKSLNLTQVAASFGYQLDRKKTSANSAFMRRSDDAVLISRAMEGWFVFCSVHDPEQSGSVIDFVAHRLGAFTANGKIDLGRVRQHLRPWLGAHAPTVSPAAYVSDLKPLQRDLVSVRARWTAMEPILDGQHSFLNQTRRILPKILAHPRFADRIRNDRGNAAFVHHNRDGICSFSLKNTGYTGEAKGSIKGLWVSTIQPTDTALVMTEAPLDAMAYCQLFKLADTARFASLSGQPSPAQLELVRGVLEKLPAATEVILATDNDPAGHRLADRLAELYHEVGRSDLTLRVHAPELEGADWADMLREGHAPNLSPPPP